MMEGSVSLYENLRHGLVGRGKYQSGDIQELMQHGT